MEPSTKIEFDLTFVVSMSEQLKVGALDELEYLDDLQLKIVVPFNQHSFKSLQILNDRNAHLDLSLSSKSTKLNNEESIRLCKCKGRIAKLVRHTKGAEVTFTLDEPPEFSTINL